MTESATAPGSQAGLAEAAAGTFALDSLDGADPALLAWLCHDDAPAAAERASWHLHLPARLELGEPVLGWLEVGNPTRAAQLVPADIDPASGLVVAEIAYEGGEPVPFEPARLDCGAGWTWLMPGQRRCLDIQLSFGRRSGFTRPGRYRITLRVPGLDDIAASHGLVVEPPAGATDAGVERVFADERIGLALTGDGAIHPAALADLGAEAAIAPPGLARLVVRHEMRQRLVETADAPAVEAAARRLHGRILADARADRCRLRRLHHARELRELAVSLLRRDALPAAVAGRLAGRAASSAARLAPAQAGPDTAAGRRIAAVRHVAGRMASR
jgi:hypothetical protein